MSEFIHVYSNALDDASLDTSCEMRRRVHTGQAAYDVYFEERDPALRVFERQFGKEVGAVAGVLLSCFMLLQGKLYVSAVVVIVQWTDLYTRGFLFPLAHR